MFEHPGEEALGFKGNPPERSMYETLLKASRLHRKQGERFAFLPPDHKAEQPVKDLWKAIDGFLSETDNGRQSVEKLFTLLRRSPFGLKDGVLPVLLAVVRAHGHSQVALYEEGSFVPRPNAAVFERIFRSPEKFDLQRFRIAGPRVEVFQQYAAMLSREAGKEPDLLTVVRPLVRMVKDLPDYVSKTRQLAETTQRVLRAMKEARQPDLLLFTDLPIACGFAAFAARGKVDRLQVEAYFTRLRDAFGELQRAYPHLLAEIERLILRALGEDGPLTPARQSIEHHARLILNVAVDTKLKAFLMRAADNGIEDTTWLESIATLLSGKPPTQWDDGDRARFEVQLEGMAQRTYNVLRHDTNGAYLTVRRTDHLGQWGPTGSAQTSSRDARQRRVVKRAKVVGFCRHPGSIHFAIAGLWSSEKDRPSRISVLASTARRCLASRHRHTTMRFAPQGL